MTQLDAFKKAIYLCFTAPDEARAAKAKELAICFTKGLTPAQVEQAKVYALKAFFATGAA